MNRCAPSLLALALACAGTLATLAPAGAHAQVLNQRRFTKDALRGKIEFGASPFITLNGQSAVMATGYQVRGTDNLIKMAAGLDDGRTYTVNYMLDMSGQVAQVWILSAAEAAKEPWPRKQSEAQSWTFDAFTQTWTKS